MKIKLINYGGKAPERAHYNDAGADVFANISRHNCDNCEDLSIDIPPYSIKKIPLGIGLKLPDGFVAFVLPRSGMSTKKGITAEVVPIDSGYRGEIHAILYNANDHTYRVRCGDKIAQLVILPVVIPEFSEELGNDRDDAAFGSTDKV